MAQLARPDADAALRRWLIELRSERRMMFTNTMLGDSVESAAYTYTELSKRIDPLLAGEAVSLRRFELPVGHPAAALGHPCDGLVLGADDVLRPFDRSVTGIRGPVPG